MNVLCADNDIAKTTQHNLILQLHCHLAEREREREREFYNTVRCIVSVGNLKIYIEIQLSL